MQEHEFPEARDLMRKICPEKDWTNEFFSGYPDAISYKLNDIIPERKQYKLLDELLSQSIWTDNQRKWLNRCCLFLISGCNFSFRLPKGASNIREMEHFNLACRTDLQGSAHYFGAMAGYAYIKKEWNYLEMYMGYYDNASQESRCLFAENFYATIQEPNLRKDKIEQGDISVYIDKLELVFSTFSADTKKASDYYQLVSTDLQRRKDMLDQKKSKEKDLVKKGNALNEVLTVIKNGECWEINNSTFPDTIDFMVKFPNGKQGEIDMAIVDEYGTLLISQGLWHKVSFAKDQIEKVELILGYYYVNHVCASIPIINFYTSSTDPSENKEVRELLSKYYNYYILGERMRYAGNDLRGTTAFRKSRQLLRKHYNYVKNQRENLYNDLVASGAVKSRWKSEQQVFMLARELYSDAIYQYHSDWLGMQSLDVFIPSLHLGIEYQGLQHYEPVEYFGGQEKFEEGQRRDERKRRLCRDNGIKLLEWKYDVEISEENMKEKLSEILSKN